MPYLNPLSNNVFLNNYTNNNGLCIFSEQEYEYILLRKKKTLQITQYCVMCIAQDCNT